MGMLVHKIAQSLHIVPCCCLYVLNMSPGIYFSFAFGEALELAYILLFGIPLYLTLSCIKIWIKKNKKIKKNK